MLKANWIKQKLVWFIFVFLYERITYCGLYGMYFKHNQIITCLIYYISFNFINWMITVGDPYDTV